MNALDNYLKTKTRGAAAELARRLNIPPVLISQWRHGTQKVPEDKCLMIESVTDGKLICEDLRPDVPWFVIRGKK